MTSANVFVFDLEPFDGEIAWARSLLTKHQAKITPEFRELLLSASEHGVEHFYVPEVVASEATGRIIVRSQLPPQFVALLSTLGTGEV